MRGTGGLCISIRARIVIHIRIPARLAMGPWFCQSTNCEHVVRALAFSIFFYTQIGSSRYPIDIETSIF